MQNSKEYVITAAQNDEWHHNLFVHYPNYEKYETPMNIGAVITIPETNLGYLVVTIPVSIRMMQDIVDVAKSVSEQSGETQNGQP